MKQQYCTYCLEDITKEQDFYSFLKQDSLLCTPCQRQLRILNVQTKLADHKLHILYEYNEFLEGMIFQYKEGHDIALQEAFFHGVMKEINRKFRHYAIVVMPSSKEKLAERGFHPVKEMLKNCRLPVIEPFYKNENRKQSLQSIQNRAFISQVIKKKPGFILPKKRLLLIDDVCTSGATMECAYNLLQGHTYKMEALVLCAHPLFVEMCDKKGLKKKGIFSIL